MSFEKDFCLIFFAVIILCSIYNCVLMNKIKSQKEYFVNTLKNDFRVSLIAQIRALELIQKQNSMLSSAFLLNEVTEASKYTLDMITMIMDTYKLECGENIFNPDYFDINGCIKNVVNQIDSLVCQKGVKFDYHINTSRVFADEKYISKILKYILCASVEYSKQNSNIGIFIDKKGTKLSFNIFYEGKSLSMEERSRMFSKESKFSTVGYGIRMYLCKKIIGFHNGSIKYKEIGDKNNFCFTLPCHRENVRISLLKPRYIG